LKALIQRVSRANVRVDDALVGSIGNGIVVLLGVTGGDTNDLAEFLAAKTANLRIFDDEDGVMNRSALDCLQNPGDSVAVLVVSQFTLYADCRKGRRPSYVRAAAPDVARPLVEYFVECLTAQGLEVETGVFGAEMAVEMVNDGPVTILLDSDELRPSL
jgi:D-tyrosyl-tRNA(Tyr) deacylase